MNTTTDLVFIEYGVTDSVSTPIEKGVLPLPSTFSKAFRISPDTLSQRFDEFFRGLSTALSGIPSDLSSYHVDSIELSLTFDMKLGLEIIAKAESNIQNCIKIVLKRSPAS